MDVKSLVPWRRDRRELTQPAWLEAASPMFGLHRRVNRLFDDFFRDFDNPMLRGMVSEWPAIDIIDEDRETKIVAELPGLEEKDLDLSLRDGILTIHGEKTRKSNTPVYSERWHGQFTRAVELGQDIDPDKVSASYVGGVLTVTVGKRHNPKTEAKKIIINHG